MMPASSGRPLRSSSTRRALQASRRRRRPAAATGWSAGRSRCRRPCRAGSAAPVVSMKLDASMSPPSPPLHTSGLRADGGERARAARWRAPRRGTGGRPRGCGRCSRAGSGRRRAGRRPAPRSARRSPTRRASAARPAAPGPRPGQRGGRGDRHVAVAVVRRVGVVGAADLDDVGVGEVARR